ncbi:hypothetical protein Tco_0363253 [Tanacetum coccineum]
MFTNEEKSPFKTIPDVTSDTKSKCDNQEPLPPLPKLSGAEPISTSVDVIPPADLTQTYTISNKTTHVIRKESSVKASKKKAQTKSPSVRDPSPKKNANSSIEKLLFTLINEVVVKKTISKLKALSSQDTSSRKALKILKPFIPCKYYRFNDHHSDECECYPRCDIYGSIAHEPSKCDKNTIPNNRKQRFAIQRSNEPNEK